MFGNKSTKTKFTNTYNKLKEIDERAKEPGFLFSKHFHLAYALEGEGFLIPGFWNEVVRKCDDSVIDAANRLIDFKLFNIDNFRKLVNSAGLSGLINEVGESELSSRKLKSLLIQGGPLANNIQDMRPETPLLNTDKNNAQVFNSIDNDML
ncbi:hypothetical protein L3V83_13605 [Thiotrichales bacterium 19X7-9]|nr:hypothetical protein [Thiotrichales bacterium 19X7-9]